MVILPITDMCVIYTVYTNESKYTREDVDSIDVDENGPPEHLWDNIAPSTEEQRLHSLAEGSKQLTEVSQQDLQDNQNMLSLLNSVHWESITELHCRSQHKR